MKITVQITQYMSYIAHLRKELDIEPYYQQFGREKQALENEW
jgi:hypothetical protein